MQDLIHAILPKWRSGIMPTSSFRMLSKITYNLRHAKTKVFII